MIRRLVLRGPAEIDIDRTTAWYESQRRGLGSSFLDAVDALFDRIRESPNQFPEIGGGVRRAIINRFPYGTYFIIREEVVVVLAVVHLHRHPDAWRGKDRSS